MKMHID